MTEQQTDRDEPTGGWIVAGLALVALGVVVLGTPVRSFVTWNGVPAWAVAVALLLVGAWFVWSGFLMPRSRGNPPLRSQDIGMPHDPAIYDPADYERRPGYVTEVDGRTGQTTVVQVVAIVAGLVGMAIGGLLGVDRWLAWPGAVVLAVIAWQLMMITRPRRPARRR